MIKTQVIPNNERPDFTGQTVTVVSNKPLYGQPSPIVSYGSGHLVHVSEVRA